MAAEEILDKIQDLSDLELAALLCLTNQEHCIVDTNPDTVEDLVQELRLIAANTFGLTHVVVDCTSQTTLDDFTIALFPDNPRADSPTRHRNSVRLTQPGGFRSHSYSTPLDTQKIASVVVARSLSSAPRLVQIQALELIRTKHLFTHSGRHTTPSPFLLIAVIPTDAPRLTEHLNSHFFISHYHDPSSGYPNLQDLDLSDSASIASVVRRPGLLPPSLTPIITPDEISYLRSSSQPVKVTYEITQYLMNVISYLRIHRFVAGGISPLATKHCMQLCKSLAPLHGLNFVTPSLVGLAVKKIYAHRIQLVTPEEERSVQWGSKIDDVAAMLEGIDAQGVIEDVLASVEVPL